MVSAERAGKLVKAMGLYEEEKKAGSASKMAMSGLLCTSKRR